MFNKENIQKVADLLIRHKHTIAVAESVTGGFLQAALSSAENASTFFQGGITAYNITQKYTHLHINLAHAIACNCVSEQTAREMAIGVGQSFSSNWGVSITGYASPVPGHHMEELYAWYAIVFDHECITSGYLTAEIKDPQNVQIEYTDAVVLKLLEQIRLKDNL